MELGWWLSQGCSRLRIFQQHGSEIALQTGKTQFNLLKKIIFPREQVVSLYAQLAPFWNRNS